MALGIDIYRYQTVTDWQAVKRHGVSFVYVKGTDGGGLAQVRATAQARGAIGVGLPVGLYHYAQLSPSPEVQADILTGEVRRLGATGLPPALDLEDPHQPGGAARAFAHRFLTRLRNNGFPQVTLYGNTSMLTGINADTLGVPGTVIWLAAYGPNTGNRHPYTYRGRVHIHQYTSVGTVPGISGRVDLNESLTALPDAGKTEADMDLTDTIRFDDGRTVTVSKALAESWQNSYDTLAAVRTLASNANPPTTATLTEEQLDALAEKVAALHDDLTVDEVKTAVSDVLLHGAAAQEGQTP